MVLTSYICFKHRSTELIIDSMAFALLFVIVRLVVETTVVAARINMILITVYNRIA